MRIQIDSEYDYEDTDDIVCPYCGHVTPDSWECKNDNENYECPDCEKVFEYYRNVSVTYSSCKKEGQ